MWFEIRFSSQFCLNTLELPLQNLNRLRVYTFPNTKFTFLLHLTITCNRLVPVTIAAFRYIMVCHAVFVQNHGGEKKVVTKKKLLVRFVTLGFSFEGT